MTQATYLVFLQNTQTGEEFTAPTEAPTGAHDVAMGQIRQQYMAPKFKVHTAYMVSELEAVLNSMSRWPGLASKVQAGAQRTSPKQAPVRVTLGEAARLATSGRVSKTVEAPIAAAPAPHQPVATPATETTATPVTPTGVSVIEQLKAMRLGQ